MAASWLDYRRGVENGNAKLSVEHVRAIRRLANEGATVRALAGRFGIAKTPAWQVIVYATWRHVDDGP